MARGPGEPHPGGIDNAGLDGGWCPTGCGKVKGNSRWYQKQWQPIKTDRHPKRMEDENIPFQKEFKGARPVRSTTS